MITKRTKIMLAVLVVVALGAYAYLYWWSQTPDHGVFDSIPVVQQVSDSASRAVTRPVAPGNTPPGTLINPGTDGSPTVPSTVYKTFENTELSFSFAYPENWVVTQTKADGITNVCIRTEGGTGDCLVSLAVEKEGVNVSAEKSLEALRTEFRAGNVTESSRRIGGEEADVIRVGGYPAGEENSTRAAVFVRKGMVYELQTKQGHEAIFDRVADSFLFTM